MQKPLYKRVLLKLSGESLMGDQQFGLNASVLKRFAEDVSEIYKLGVEIGIVIGGGNFSEAFKPQNRELIKCLETIWECLPQSLMVLHFKMH